MSDSPVPFITPAALLAHWQGHRRLTRRVIEAFPDDKLFTYSVGGMRPFGALALEMIDIGVPMMRGLQTGEWTPSKDPAKTKAEVLASWDRQTSELDEVWGQLPSGRFLEHAVAFGQFPGTVHDLVLYAIDNEIHHRAQGYVYLRSLGIEPPAFYDRA